MTERSVDFEAVARDDQLLDLLGAGLAPTSTDPAIRALFAWRTDLAAGVEDVTRAVNGRAVGTARVNGTAPVTGAPRVNGSHHVTGPARVNGVASPLRGGPHSGDGDRRTEEPDTDPDDIAELPRRRGRRRAAVAAALVGLSAGLGGVAVAAADARPGSPLWPITKVIYAETAEDRQAEAAAEAALAKARRALAAGRVAEAERYLDEAGRHADSVDPEHAGELRDEMDAVRDEIDEEGGDGTDGENSPTPGPNDPSGGGKDDPLPTPSLPTPSSGAGGDNDGADGDGDGNSGKKGGKGARDDQKGRPESSSNELSLAPDTSIGTKVLPEF